MLTGKICFFLSQQSNFWGEEERLGGILKEKHKQSLVWHRGKKNIILIIAIVNMYEVFAMCQAAI